MTAAELSELVVYFVPEKRVDAPRPVRTRIPTLDKRFVPATLVVPLGSTISFPNQDPVLHNAFSLTPGSQFDLGIYGQGESRDFVFAKPGIVRVHCNVHHSMQADVVVVDTPFFATAGADGRFAFDAVPPGRGTLHMWHPRANLESQALEIPARPLELVLVASKPRIPAHTRKDGGSYRAAPPSR